MPWLWVSMKPGASVSPFASMLSFAVTPASRPTAANRVAADSDIAGEPGVTRPVQNPGVANEQVSICAECAWVSKSQRETRACRLL